MFLRIRSAYGALGVVLFLIFAFLVLSRADNAVKLVGKTGGVANTLARTLQGR